MSGILADLLSDPCFFPAEYPVFRKGSGTIDARGMYQPAAECEFKIVASAQPHTGQGLQIESDSEHSTETKVLYTCDTLRTRIVVGDDPGDKDEIEIDGSRWPVIKADHWHEHSEIYVSRVVS